MKAIMNFGAISCLFALAAAAAVDPVRPVADAAAPRAYARPDAIDDKPVRASIEKALREQHIPGLAAALVIDGDVAWAQGFGVADVATQRAVTPDTVFVMASVSKTVIAAAMMHAVEHGTLSLDADINSVLPFPVRNPHFPAAGITLRELATHTSGIIDGPVYLSPASYYFGGDNPISLGAFLAAYLTPGGKFYDADQNFSQSAPGVKWEYSNIGAALAALTIDSATGIPFDAYCRRYLFEPLGMVDTGWHQRDVDMRRHATPYAVADGHFVPYPHYGLATWPDGGLRTTVIDFGRFLGMLMQGGTLHGVTVLKAASIQTMLASQSVTVVRKGPPARTISQSLFWISDGVPDGQPKRFRHSGGDPGATTEVVFDPQQRVGVIVFTNADPTHEIGASLGEIVDLLFKAAHRAAHTS